MGCMVEAAPGLGGAASAGWRVPEVGSRAFREDAVGQGLGLPPRRLLDGVEVCLHWH